MIIKYEVEVTQRDIDEGKTRDCTHCPVALAIARAMGLPEVHVAHDFFVAASGGPEIKLPPEVSIFIRQFDLREPVSPFTFELTIP